MNNAAGGSSRTDQKRLTWAAGLTAGILILEVAGGVLSHSLSLLSDAGHMMVDLLALLLSLFAMRFACRPATDRKTFGYYRLEILAALLNGSVLVILSLYLFYEAVRRLIRPQIVDTRLMLGVAGVGLLANLIGIALLSPSRGNLTVRSALLHILGDAFSSVGVILGGLAMQATGWYRADPLLSLLIGVVILAGAFRLMREACDILLEAAPTGIALPEVSRAIASVSEVVGIHDLHVWSLTIGRPALSGHVVVRGDGSLVNTDHILNRIKCVLEERFGICHTTIQLESEAYEEVGEIHGAGEEPS